MVLVIANLIYYSFMYYPSKFECKPCRFVRDWRNVSIIGFHVHALPRLVLNGLDLYQVPEQNSTVRPTVKNHGRIITISK